MSPRCPFYLRPFLSSSLCLIGLLILTSPGESAIHDVSVRNFQFVPANLTIQQGDIVRWNWVEGMHTTTSGTHTGTPDGLWDAPLTISNTVFQRTFNDAPGSYTYFCTFHVGGGMVGTITVQAGANNPPNVVNPGTQNGMEDTFFSVTVNAFDGDGDALTMTDQGTTPSWATFTDNGDNSATISGTPAIGDAGTYSQTVRASDGVDFDEETFDIVIAENPVATVTLTGTGFDPPSVTRKVGQSVQWVKDTGGNHTTTNGTGPGDPNAGILWDSPLTAQSPTFTYQFSTAGTYSYFCANHPTDETGTVTVNDTTVVGIGDDPRSGRIGPLQPPYPNPFSSKVGLVFDLERASPVRIHIFGIDGRSVRTLLIGEFPAGSHEVIWEGRDNLGSTVAAGMYFVRLETRDGTTVRKVFKAR